MKTYPVATFLLLLAALMGGVNSQAYAAVLCTPKSGEGTIKIRETSCKKNEVQLNPATVGWQGPSAAVRDSNNNFVGPILGAGAPLEGWNEGKVEVLYQVGDSAVRFRVDKAGLVESSRVHVFEHESSDCSGTAFISHQDNQETELVKAGIVRGTTVYYLLGSTVTINLRSSSEVPVTTCGELFIPPNICCHSSGLLTILRSPLGTLDLSYLVPPFHVEVKP